MVDVDPISAPRSTFTDAAPNRTGLCIFEIFHEICLFCLRRKAKCCLLPRIFPENRFFQFSPTMFGKFLKKSPENGNGDSSDPDFRSFFDRDPPQKTAPSRTQEPSRASVRMLEKCLSTKIFNPGGFRRKTPAVIIGGRKTEKHSQNPEFDDFLLQQFPHCNTGSTGSEKRGNS